MPYVETGPEGAEFFPKSTTPPPFDGVEGRNGKTATPLFLEQTGLILGSLQERLLECWIDVVRISGLSIERA